MALRSVALAQIPLRVGEPEQRGIVAGARGEGLLVASLRAGLIALRAREIGEQAMGLRIAGAQGERALEQRLRMRRVTTLACGRSALEQLGQ